MTDTEKRKRLRTILAAPDGILAPGAPDPLLALMVQDCGFQLAHLAGNAMHKSLGLPDRGLVGLAEVAERARQITDAVSIPLLVDGESGYGGTDQIARAVRQLERAGASGIRFEDSRVGQGGYGISRDAGVTPLPDMLEKLQAAVDARTDKSLVLAVRCDAQPTEGLAGMQDRMAAYAEAGADALGVQLTELEDFRAVGAFAPKPLVTLWPRELINGFDFLKLGYQVGLVTSSAPLAALAGARAMLQALQKSGTERDYFATVAGFQEVNRWYRNVGTPKPH